VLEVRVLGDSPLSYAWQLNGQAIAGSGPALVLTAIEAP
jgi:hypothetical protein